MADPRTVARLEARIKERLAHAIEFEVADPRSTFLTIQKVELSRDLSSGKVLYSVLGDRGERSKAQHMLADASGFLQRKAGSILRTRHIPRLTWVYDDSIEKLAEMDELIRGAMEKDREINPEAHEE